MLEAAGWRRREQALLPALQRRTGGCVRQRRPCSTAWPRGRRARPRSSAGGQPPRSPEPLCAGPARATLWATRRRWRRMRWPCWPWRPLASRRWPNLRQTPAPRRAAAHRCSCARCGSVPKAWPAHPGPRPPRGSARYWRSRPCRRCLSGTSGGTRMTSGTGPPLAPRARSTRRCARCGCSSSTAAPPRAFRGLRPARLAMSREPAPRGQPSFSAGLRLGIW
mmetsp:Transcript_75247/g.213046  ORF Transcript_75247/g.213046 Transcript_75247/m.213046 type:complete len:222 (-) Transcript_75247:54-719(-)